MDSRIVVDNPKAVVHDDDRAFGNESRPVADESRVDDLVALGPPAPSPSWTTVVPAKGGPLRFSSAAAAFRLRLRVRAPMGHGFCFGVVLFLGEEDHHASCGAGGSVSRGGLGSRSAYAGPAGSRGGMAPRGALDSAGGRAAESCATGNRAMSSRDMNSRLSMADAGGQHQHSPAMQSATAIWTEVKNERQLYCVGGRGLLSPPVVTRAYAATSCDARKKALRRRSATAELGEHLGSRAAASVCEEVWELHVHHGVGVARLRDGDVALRFVGVGGGDIAFFNASTAVGANGSTAGGAPGEEVEVQARMEIG